MNRPHRLGNTPANTLSVLLCVLFSILLAVALSSVVGCGSDDDSAEQTAIVVTADWVNRSLTVFALDSILDASIPTAQAIVGTVDLSAWPPGPIEIEIAPDGRTAVVAVGPAFFADGPLNALIGSPDVEEGSAVLIVDVRALQVTSVIETEDAPLGIAITDDGTRAYTANFGGDGSSGDTVSVIDLREQRLIEEFRVDGSPEQIAIHADGIAIVNIAGDGGVQVFDLDDPSTTLSPVVRTGADPSDVTFLGDATRAAVANSFSGDVSLVDTSDPDSPRLIDSFPIGGIAPYGVTYLPRRNQVLAPRAITSDLVLLDVDGDTLVPSDPIELTGGPFVLGAAVDAAEDHAFVPHMNVGADPQLSIVDLDTGEVRGISWLATSGPSYVAVWP